MKSTAKDTKKSATKAVKDLKAGQDVKGGMTGAKLSDKDGNVAGAGGRLDITVR